MDGSEDHMYLSSSDTVDTEPSAPADDGSDDEMGEWDEKPSQPTGEEEKEDPKDCDEPDEQVYVDIANARNPAAAWDLHQFRTAAAKGEGFANVPLAADFDNEEEDSFDDMPPLEGDEQSAMEDVD